MANFTATDVYTYVKYMAVILITSFILGYCAPAPAQAQSTDWNTFPSPTGTVVVAQNQYIRVTCTTPVNKACKATVDVFLDNEAVVTQLGDFGTWQWHPESKFYKGYPTVLSGYYRITTDTVTLGELANNAVLFWVVKVEASCFNLFGENSVCLTT